MPRLLKYELEMAALAFSFSLAFAFADFAIGQPPVPVAVHRPAECKLSKCNGESWGGCNFTADVPQQNICVTVPLIQNKQCESPESAGTVKCYGKDGAGNNCSADVPRCP